MDVPSPSPSQTGFRTTITAVRVCLYILSKELTRRGAEMELEDGRRSRRRRWTS